MRRPAKRRVKRVDQLRRQVDLGHQHEGLASGRERQAGGAQVDLGLAAAGDAVEERRSGALAGHRRGDRAGRLGLVAGQRRFRVGGVAAALLAVAYARCRRADPVGDRVAAEPAQLGRQHRRARSRRRCAGSSSPRTRPARTNRRRATAARRRPRRSRATRRGRARPRRPSTRSVRRPRADRKAPAPTIPRRAGADFDRSSEGVRPAWRGASTSTLTVASASAMSSTSCVLTVTFRRRSHSARKFMIWRSVLQFSTASVENFVDKSPAAPRKARSCLAWRHLALFRGTDMHSSKINNLAETAVLRDDAPQQKWAAFVTERSHGDKSSPERSLTRISSRSRRS